MKLAFSTVGVASAAWSHVKYMNFAEWQDATGIHYNSAEADVREEIFNENTARMVEHNSQESTWWAAQNQFSAMSEDEFVATMLNFEVSQSIANTTDIPVYEVDYSLRAEVGDKDWSVSPVKNQGSCGSCWAFGAVAGMEGSARTQLSRNDILSEQYVMDCTSSNACSGGRADSAYPQLYGKALYTGSSYPYKAKNGNCGTGTDSGLRVSSFTRTSRPVSDSALASALDSNPQVVAVAASSWSSYGGGIYSDSSCSLNHQVYLTGYTSGSFKVKNSWGSGWGEGGYIRLARGSSSSCGTSGILSDGAFYPKMGSSSVEV